MSDVWFDLDKIEAAWQGPEIYGQRVILLLISKLRQAQVDITTKSAEIHTMNAALDAMFIKHLQIVNTAIKRSNDTTGFRDHAAEYIRDEIVALITTPVDLFTQK